MKPGDVLLGRFVQADGRLKPRPMLFLAQFAPFGDFLVCGISSQLRHEVAGFDDLLLESDSDIPLSGLKTSSLIRLGYLAVYPLSQFNGTLGSVAPVRLQSLLSRLGTHFTTLAQKLS